MIPHGVPRDGYFNLLARLLRLPEDAPDAQVESAAAGLSSVLQKAGWQPLESRMQKEAMPSESPWKDALAEIAGTSAHSPFFNESLASLIKALGALGYYDEPQITPGDAVTMLSADIPALINLACIRYGLTDSERDVAKCLGISAADWRKANPEEESAHTFARMNLHLCMANNMRLLSGLQQKVNTLARERGVDLSDVPGDPEVESAVMRQLGISAERWAKL